MLIESIVKHNTPKDDDNAKITKNQDIALDSDDYERNKIKNMKMQQIIPSEKMHSFRDILGEKREDIDGWHFDIFAEVEELKCVVKYSLRTATKGDMDKMIDTIQREKAKYAELQASTTLLMLLQQKLRNFYDVYTSFGIMAGLLVVNFIIDIVQSEMRPEAGTREARIFQAFDISFTVLFTVDLVINFFSHSPRTFFRKGWNLLDLVIISLSLLSISSADGTSINTFRTIRAIRAVRLLSGVSKLRGIVDALLISVRNSLPLISVLMQVRPAGPPAVARRPFCPQPSRSQSRPLPGRRGKQM